MQHLSAKEIAEKWGVNVSLAKRFCSQGRIPGVVFQGGIWRIPEDAIRPTRTILERTEEPELPELAKKLQNQKKSGIFTVCTILSSHPVHGIASFCTRTKFIPVWQT